MRRWIIWRVNESGNVRFVGKSGCESIRPFVYEDGATIDTELKYFRNVQPLHDWKLQEIIFG